MEMKGGSGMKCKPQYSERMLNVLDLHSSAPDGKAVSRICASKPRRNLQTIGWCLQFKQSYLCENKQGNHCNWRKSFKEARLRKVQHYPSSLKEEKPLQFLIPLTLLPKNHCLFYEHKEGWNGGGEKRKIGVHQLIMQKYSTRGRGVCEERGGAAAPLYTVCPRAVWYVSDMTICEIHKLWWISDEKRKLTYRDLDPGNSWNLKMSRRNSQITSDCWPTITHPSHPPPVLRGSSSFS